MATKSLKKRIDELVNALGKALTPQLATNIRGELVELGGLVEALENGQASAEQEARITALETQLGNLQVTLEAANVEIETFRAEQKKRENKEREINDTQFKILKGLPTEHLGDGATLKGISGRANLLPDEVAVHLNRLEKTGNVKKRDHRIGHAHVMAWFRTIEGDELVLAKRLAGEEEEQNKRKFADLPDIQHQALLAVSKGHEEIGAAEDEIARLSSKASRGLGLNFASSKKQR